MCTEELGIQLLFIECICDDDELTSKNIEEILHYSDDYKNMNPEEAMEDLKNKVDHYLSQYEPIDPVAENLSYIKVIDGGRSVTAHKLQSQRESAILGYLANFKPMPQTLFFTRVIKIFSFKMLNHPNEKSLLQMCLMESNITNPCVNILSNHTKQTQYNELCQP